MRWGVGIVVASLLVGCDVPRRDAPKDTPPDDAVDIDASRKPPPPPPTVDAPPPPMLSCSAEMPACKLPPSTCLDASYLLYYTDGTCVGDQCRYATNLFYCTYGCYEGGCQPGGFT